MHIFRLHKNFVPANFIFGLLFVALLTSCSGNTLSKSMVGTECRTYLFPHDQQLLVKESKVQRLNVSPGGFRKLRLSGIVIRIPDHISKIQEVLIYPASNHEKTLCKKIGNFEQQRCRYFIQNLSVEAVIEVPGSMKDISKIKENINRYLINEAFFCK